MHLRYRATDSNLNATKTSLLYICSGLQHTVSQFVVCSLVMKYVARKERKFVATAFERRRTRSWDQVGAKRNSLEIRETEKVGEKQNVMWCCQLGS